MNMSIGNSAVVGFVDEDGNLVLVSDENPLPVESA